MESEHSLETQREEVYDLLGLKGEERSPDNLNSTLRTVIFQLDAQAMRTLIPHRLVWSDTETEAFFSQPENTPLAPIDFATDKAERRKQYITIGHYLVADYNRAKAANNLTNEGTRLRLFVENATGELFGDDYVETNNQFNGIDTQSVRDGSPRLTEEYSSFLHEVSNNNTKIVDRAIQITGGGDFQSMITFLQFGKGTTEDRAFIENVVEQRIKDRVAAKGKLELTWKMEEFKRQMGMDLELFYELNNTSLDDINSQMKTYLAVVPDINTALENLPRSRELYNKDRYLDSLTIYRESATVSNHPDALPYHDESTIRNVTNEVSSLLHLGATKPLSYIHFITAPGGRSRSSDISYYNNNNELVKIVYVNGNLPITKLRQTLAHELIQSTHAELVNNAYHVPINEVDSKQREEVSNIIEEQIDLIDGSAKTSGAELLKDRFQAQYALIQNHYRMIIDNRLKQGIQLDDEAIQEIFKSVEARIAMAMRIGIPTSQSLIGIGNTLEPMKPLDGYRYVQKPKDQEFPLKEAMNEKYGNTWLGNTDACAVFYFAIAKMGDTDELRSSAEIIAQSTPQEAREKLLQWNFTI